ncbi:MAG: OmpA family protein [Bacteriovoracaceae bacterium]|jgi:outer membrane protein OmpA-like peptidoglycan-associated protein|nr:OmpA family protein [Bacteriovoracaceae bacterium]
MLRSKKNREVNIFSASVVDLFASGLGVFLIVAIIALVNQKKENEAAGNLKVAKQKSNMMTLDSNQEVKLKNNISQLQKEIVELKTQMMRLKENQGSFEDEITYKMKIESLKVDLARANETAKNEKEQLERQLEQQKMKVSELNKKVEQIKNTFVNDQSEQLNPIYLDYKVGSRIRLKNVHFYPGTERPIEPYASREVADLAKFLMKNPKVTIEVSGHIYETKKAIEQGKADDIYNLSGRRAKAVCKMLEGYGIAPERLQCLGYGANRPIHLTNDQYSEEAQKNRRVEVEILSK